MAYTRTNWADRSVATPMTFTVAAPIVVGTPFTLTPSEGAIANSGTPLNAANLNKIEQGLVDLDTGKVSDTGDTMTGTLAINKQGAGLQLKGTGTGIASSQFFEFYDGAGTRQGYLGKPNATTADFRWSNEQAGGDISLVTTGGGKVVINTDLALTTVGNNFKVQSGVNAGSATGLMTVTFPTAFSAAPIVVATPRSSAGVHTQFYTINVTSSSFQIQHSTTDWSARQFAWIAIGT